MTFSLQLFHKGIYQSFIDVRANEIKQSFNNEGRDKAIDRFSRTIITALFDYLQFRSIEKRAMPLLNKGTFFKQRVSTPFSKQAVLTLLLTKTFLNMSSSLAGDVIGKKTKKTFEKIHSNIEALLPVASAIVAIASMNLVFIAGYSLHLGFSYLEKNDSLTSEMRSICKYSSWILGLSSISLK